MGDIGLEPQQPLDRRRRPGPRPRFERLAEQHQRDDRGGGLEIDVLVQPEHGDDRAPQPRDRRAERDQHVHVRAAAAKRVPRARVEPAADDELDGRRQCELQPARQQILVRRRARHEHGRHLREQRRRQYRREQQLPAQRVPCGRAPRRFERALGFLVAPHVRAVAGPGHGAEKRVDVRARTVEADPSRFGREIDAGLDTRKAVQRLLDPRRAGGAGHAFERELDPLGRRGRRRLRSVEQRAGVVHRADTIPE